MARHMCWVAYDMNAIEDMGLKMKHVSYEGALL
jgi:hypothetical protein